MPVLRDGFTDRLHEQPEPTRPTYEPRRARRVMSPADLDDEWIEQGSSRAQRLAEARGQEEERAAKRRFMLDLMAD